MKKLRFIGELEYDDTTMHGKDFEAKKWFYQEVLGDEGLLLHSNKIGDTIGTVRIEKIINEDEP